MSICSRVDHFLYYCPSVPPYRTGSLMFVWFVIVENLIVWWCVWKTSQALQNECICFYNKHKNDTCTKQNLSSLYNNHIDTWHMRKSKFATLKKLGFRCVKKQKIMLFIFRSKKKKHVYVFVFEWLYNKCINDTWHMHKSKFATLEN